MRKNWVKRLIPAVCAGIFCFAGASPVSAATGQSLRAVPIEKTGENRVVSGLRWKDCSSYYFYNQLPENERRFCDALMEECLLYMDGGGDIQKGPDGDYELPGVPFQAMTVDRAFEVFHLFRDNNSQFYYLNAECGIAEDCFYPYVYPAFSKEADRRAATARFAESLAELEKPALTVSSDYQKVKTVHDTICRRFSYETGSPEEEKAFLESSYSAVVNRRTQCGGYAKTFALLCNRLGVDAIVVGSDTHGWNCVKIDDVWYELDCTWDDAEGYTAEGGPILYDWFLRSEEAVSELETENDHVFSTTYRDYTPKCTRDCPPSADSMKAGKPSGLAGVAGAPELTVENGKVRFSADPEAKVYYTLNRCTPQEGQAKSFLYRSPVKLRAGLVVKARAVIDFGRSSRVLTWILRTGEDGKLLAVLEKK